MNEQCPTCKRRFSQDHEQCRRCGTDLHQIKTLLNHFEETLTEGRQLLRHDAVKAEQYLRNALSMIPQSAEAKKALSLALLMQKRFGAALLVQQTL